MKEKKKRIQFFVLSGLVILTRLLDAVFTFQYTPDLTHEANPLVVFMGFEWGGIILFQCLGIIFVSYVNYKQITSEYTFLPKEKNLSLKSFAAYTCYGKSFRLNLHKWYLLFCFPIGKERNRYILGWVLPRALILVGFFIIILHLLLKYSVAYQSIHYIALPFFYFLIVISVVFCYYLFIRTKYKEYQELSV